ncbi:hypothetical protein MNBD_BACTEROID06-458 [hydrothermal vent metagenome]|uniref:Uncharacterized protein n=1 Tax=hydrothermal vent metagenome TaxID=652676 RepID=A0A3B0UUI8_9ZZZZ
MIWEGLKDKDINQVATDYWKAYENFVPKETHVQSKAETFTVEGHSTFLSQIKEEY